MKSHLDGDKTHDEKKIESRRLRFNDRTNEQLVLRPVQNYYFLPHYNELYSTCKDNQIQIEPKCNEKLS